VFAHNNCFGFNFSNSQDGSEIVITGLDPVIHPLRKSLLRRLMDARIKSGHDKETPRREAPEFCQQHPALRDQRAQGMPGARRARSLVCEIKKHTSIVTTVTPESPGIPYAMVYGLYRALPGDRAFLPPSPAELPPRT
jgi:hypothetical protein